MFPFSPCRQSVFSSTKLQALNSVSLQFQFICLFVFSIEQNEPEVENSDNFIEERCVVRGCISQRVLRSSCSCSCRFLLLLLMFFVSSFFFFFFFSFFFFFFLTADRLARLALPCGRSRVQTPSGPTPGVFK